jgi:hypothetical protein
MTSAYAISVVPAAGASASWRTRPRVEKICDSNASHGERDDTTRHRAQSHVQSSAGKLCQSETTASAPQWHERRLTSPFVAQLLGQVLAEEAAPPRLAPQSYARHVVPAAICFDDRV